LSPLPSAEVARWVQENVKGALVPSEVIERLEGATDPKSEGIRICTELLRELTTIPGISGVNMLSLGELDAIPAVIQAAGVRPG
jgi:methylenetetrahydrofolate reductase (NADPH)